MPTCREGLYQIDQNHYREISQAHYSVVFTISSLDIQWPVVQLAERLVLVQEVAGSSPAGPAKYLLLIM